MTDVDEKFFAWLDGELSGDEAAAMEARVGASPELSAMAEKHRAMQARLKAAFDPIAEAPVSEPLRAAMRPPAEVVDFGAAARARACRHDDRWQVRGLFAAPEGQGSTYRMAGGMDPNLAALVDSTMAGEPFNAAQERQAKARGWR